MQLDGLKAVARFANNLDLGHDSKESDEALSHHVMVVYYKSFDSICHVFIPFRSIAVRLA
jgi:hypothetical protein